MQIWQGFKPLGPVSHYVYDFVKLPGLTKKELIEGGWIDKYILGLTSEEESHEVERLANLYPDIQEEINTSRSRLCGKFNRSLTQPAMRHSFITKRRVLYGSGIALVLLMSGFLFLCKEHFSLLRDYTSQRQRLAQEEARVNQFASLTKMASEKSAFIHAEDTKRIKLKGCEQTPEAEVVVFQCKLSGKMMLRVVDLPELTPGQHYEVWAQQADATNKLIGKLESPIRYDSLYVLDSSLHSTALQITMMDTATMHSEPVCIASVTR